MSLLFYFLLLILSIALCVVAFLIISAGDLTKFKNIHKRTCRTSILPIVSRYGDLITSPQELDVHLTVLRGRLRDKFQELESFKGKVHTRIEQLQRFDNYKKGCVEMQANLVKAEMECKELKSKIDYYTKVQVRVQEDLVPGGTFMGDADWFAGTSRVAV